MGKKIDNFVLTCVIMLALYLYFYYAFASHVIAVALAMLTGVVLLRGFNKLKKLILNSSLGRKHRLKKCAGRAIMNLACMPSDEADEEIHTLLTRCYGDEFCVAVIQSHPALKLSEKQVFDIWKEHQGIDHLVICATCEIGEDCRTFVSSMKSPSIALIDANALEEMIVEHSEYLISCDTPEIRRKLRIKGLANMLLNRKNASKNIILSGSMLVLYLLTGNAIYLISSMALMFIASISFRKKRKPAKLF